MLCFSYTQVLIMNEINYMYIATIFLSTSTGCVKNNNSYVKFCCITNYYMTFTVIDLYYYTF